MNDVYVDASNHQTFNQDSKECAILKIKLLFPADLLLEHIPVKEKVKNIKVNRLKKGYVIGKLTSLELCEIVKMGGKLFEFYEGVIYRKKFEISPFRKVIEKLFALRQNYKDERNDLMQNLVIMILNSLNGAQI